MRCVRCMSQAMSRSSERPGRPQASNSTLRLSGCSTTGWLSAKGARPANAQGLEMLARFAQTAFQFRVHRWRGSFRGGAHDAAGSIRIISDTGFRVFAQHPQAFAPGGAPGRAN
jgi:hypothetical protein